METVNICKYGEKAGDILSRLQAEIEMTADRLHKRVSEVSSTLSRTQLEPSYSNCSSSGASASLLSSIASNTRLGELLEGCMTSHWSAEDSEGYVYGWPDTISADVAEKNAALFVVYHIRRLDRAELSSLVRCLEFYRIKNPGWRGQQAKLLIVTAFTSSHAIQKASKLKDIEVIGTSTTVTTLNPLLAAPPAPASVSVTAAANTTRPKVPSPTPSQLIPPSPTSAKQQNTAVSADDTLQVASVKKKINKKLLPSL